MNDPITPCRFHQFAERRLKVIEQQRDGIILADDLGFLPYPHQGYVFFGGRAQCRGGIVIDVSEYLEVRCIPPGGSFKRGTVSLETYKYHLVSSDGVNIVRSDGPHSPEFPDQFAEAGTANHDHHEHQHVHVYDPELEDGQNVHRTWPGQTPTLSQFLENAHDWRHGNATSVAGHEVRIWPFDKGTPAESPSAQ